MCCFIGRINELILMLKIVQSKFVIKFWYGDHKGLKTENFEFRYGRTIIDYFH